MEKRNSTLRPHLPQEVVDEVLSYHPDDIHTLHACSLVSRRFVDRSQKLMYTYISLHAPTEPLGPFHSLPVFPAPGPFTPPSHEGVPTELIFRTLSSTPRLAGHTRSLVFYNDISEAHCTELFTTILPLLINLEELYAVSSVYLLCLRSSYTLAPPVPCPSVKLLHIASMKQIPTSIFHQFPNVTNLQMNNYPTFFRVEGQDRESSNPEHPVGWAPTKLKDLYLSLNPLDFGDLASHALDDNKFPYAFDSLRKLWVMVGDSIVHYHCGCEEWEHREGIRVICEILWRSRRVIEDLTINFQLSLGHRYIPHLLHEIGFDGRQLTRLKKLYFHVPLYDQRELSREGVNDQMMFSQFFERFTNVPNLETIDILFELYDNDDGEDYDPDIEERVHKLLDLELLESSLMEVASNVQIKLTFCWISSMTTILDDDGAHTDFVEEYLERLCELKWVEIENGEESFPSMK